jgi:hypothetical protein
VAQIGAVIGREFPYAIIRAVAGTDDAVLQSALDRLTEADILLVQVVPPIGLPLQARTHSGRSLWLKSRRQVLHRRTAELLRDQFAEMVAQCSLLRSWVRYTLALASAIIASYGWLGLEPACAPDRVQARWQLVVPLFVSVKKIAGSEANAPSAAIHFDPHQIACGRN